jgi:transcriptional regulator with GAF, ATPase, and Fis domain
MERYAPLLLEVWREVCRHVEIGEAVARLAPLLARRMPLDLLLVRHLDAPHRRVETVATGVARSASELPPQRSELAEREFEELRAWCRPGRTLHQPAADLALKLPGILPEGLAGDVLAGPLLRNDGALGLLVLVARDPQQFEREHEAMLSALLEPFGVALENDLRLRELTTLREAAEADRRSLLQRLGREEVQDTIVGAEAGLRSSLERVELVKGSDVPVLILGETGSGKEVIARTIHARSQRAHGPFLRVNCGAIPAGLIDSELFGHERGSFTGATGQRKGWFERADGGTLFLDEVGELPPHAQVRLLRVLQDGSFERVGGQKPLHADVRVVAATHRDLYAMVSEGTFREDLWYRLAVFLIHLPPLRDRLEDIPALATHFALRAATRFGTAPLPPSPEDVQILASYSWPGNVRELASVIERAVILGNGRRLEVAKALGPVGPRLDAPARSAAPPAPEVTFAAPELAPTAFPYGLLPPTPPAFAPPPDTARLDAAIVQHIEAALARTYGRIEGPFGAALLLGVNPHTLRARMRKLGIEWKRFRVKR